MENNERKVNLAGIFLALAIVVIIVMGCYIVTLLNTQREQNEKVAELTTKLSQTQAETTKLQEKINGVEKALNEEEDFIFLYKGYEIKKEVGTQDLSDMEISDKNLEKYNTDYYNYENGKSKGKTKGEFGEETYEGVSVVSGVSKIAVNKEYNVYPGKFSKYENIDEFQLEGDATVKEVKQVDLDNDGKNEYLLVYYYANMSNSYSTSINLLDLKNDDKFSSGTTLVELEDGYGNYVVNGKKQKLNEDKPISLSLEDVECVDIDNDGIMEIIVDVPTYEGEKLSIYKYQNGKVEGDINHKANITP